MTNKIDINDYINLIHKLTNQHYKYKDELFNELYLKLHDLTLTFDSEKGEFINYAYLSLQRHVYKYLEKNSLNNISLNETIKFDEDEEIEKVELLESDLDLQNEIETKDFLSKRKLRENEKFIQQKYYYEGYTSQEIKDKFFNEHKIKSLKTIQKILKK